MGFVRLAISLSLALAACVSRADAPPLQQLGPPVRTTAATLPGYALRAHPSIRVALTAPHATTYRASTVGSHPVTVEVEIGNAGREPVALAGTRITFDVRRGAVHFRCAARNDVPEHEARSLMPGQKAKLARDLCSLPLPGEYQVDARLALSGSAPQHVGSFPLVVHAAGPNVPHVVSGTPGLYAAMGGSVTGMRFTKVQWASGAYHVIVRLINAGTTPIHLGTASVVFRVTQRGHPLACSATHDLATPEVLAPGESYVATVPVTCLIDVKGKYDIHALLATDGEETSLGELSVEVTSNPLLYLPVHPW